MLREMTRRDFEWWKAYDKIEPIGWNAQNWQVAAICTSVMNAAMVAARSTKRFRTTDFLLDFTDEQKKVEPPRQGRSWQEMKFIAQMCAAADPLQDGKARVNKRRR